MRGRGERRGEEGEKREERESQVDVCRCYDTWDCIHFSKVVK